MSKALEIEYFVDPGSVVRKIWGQSDVILFIFAGASAEFALNRAVDWLYYTGRLPSDPLGRMFSTVRYAKSIIFAEKLKAWHTIDAISTIHSNIEKSRGTLIPEWAFRDVLFMLIDYSIISFELLERKLSLSEKSEVHRVFYNFGIRMGIVGLPKDFHEWQIMRTEHMEKDLVFSKYTIDLLAQYRKHLGPTRFRLLQEAQKLVVPEIVKTKMNMRTYSLLSIVLNVFKIFRNQQFTKFIIMMIMPYKYQQEALEA